MAMASVTLNFVANVTKEQMDSAQKKGCIPFSFCVLGCWAWSPKDAKLYIMIFNTLIFVTPL